MGGNGKIISLIYIYIYIYLDIHMQCESAFFQGLRIVWWWSLGHSSVAGSRVKREQGIRGSSSRRDYFGIGGFFFEDVICWGYMKLFVGWLEHGSGCIPWFPCSLVDIAILQMFTNTDTGGIWVNSSGLKYVLFLYSFAWNILSWDGWLTHLVLWLLVLWLLPSPLLVSSSLEYISSIFTTICNNTICKSCFMLVFL